VLLRDLGRREEALKEHGEAKRLRSALARAHPGLPEYQSDLASTHNNLGLVLEALGKREEPWRSTARRRGSRSALAKAHPRPT